MQLGDTVSLHELSHVWKSTHIQLKNGTHKITAQECAVLGRLAEMLNPNYEGCWPSFGYLARETKLTRRSVIRIIQRLRKFGMLEILPRVHKGGNKSNIYRLDMQKLVLWKRGVGSDTVSLGVVTQCHQGVVTQCHPEPSTYRTVIRSNPSLSVSPHTGASVESQGRERPSQNQKAKPSVEGGSNGSQQAKSDRSELRALFARVKEEYPRQTGIAEAWQTWQALSPTDAVVDVIVKDIAWRKTTRQWLQDEGRFIPILPNYLKRRLWEDWSHNEI
jgi:helix-turn-helix protein